MSVENKITATFWVNNESKQVKTVGGKQVVSISGAMYLSKKEAEYHKNNNKPKTYIVIDVWEGDKMFDEVNAIELGENESRLLKVSGGFETQAYTGKDQTAKAKLKVKFLESIELLEAKGDTNNSMSSRAAGAASQAANAASDDIPF